MVSKSQIMFKGTAYYGGISPLIFFGQVHNKRQADLESVQYVSLYRRSATQSRRRQEPQIGF